MIKPDYKPHSDLQDRVSTYLISRGFVVDDAPYHEKMTREVSDRLKQQRNPTALYLRGRADRVAVHKILDLSFEWECKTHSSRKYSDICIEAMPFFHHRSRYEMSGVKCLYIYENPFNGESYGFWAHQPIKVEAVYLPERNNKESEWFAFVFGKCLPGIQIRQIGRVGGSGDPYIVIRDKTTFTHWDKLISTSIEEKDV